MSKTAVGLFEKPSVADQVVHDLGASAFPQNEIRTVREPLDMPVTGAMSFPHIDFEVVWSRSSKQSGQPYGRRMLTPEGCGVEESSFSPQGQMQRWITPAKS